MKPIKDMTAVGDTLGIMSGTLKAPTERTTKQINDAIDRVFAPNVSDSAWADFCLYASEEFLRKQWQAAHEMFITLNGDAILMRRLKKTKRLRLAWAAYAARTVLVSGTDMLRKGYTIDDEEVLVNRLEYDRNEELRQKMVVSLTGDMEVDLKTNFVARSISEQDLGTYLHFLSPICPKFRRTRLALASYLTSLRMWSVRRSPMSGPKSDGVPSMPFTAHRKRGYQRSRCPLQYKLSMAV